MVACFEYGCGVGNESQSVEGGKEKGMVDDDFFFCFLLSCKAILQFHDMKNTIFLHVNTSTVLSTHVCLNNICHVPIRLDLHLGRENEKKSRRRTQSAERATEIFFLYIDEMNEWKNLPILCSNNFCVRFVIGIHK